ncbi:tetratricopeptide repeat protein [Catellatospora sp. NPDC049111]|uniref:tetratricopeptide repeat protein n=1 Tax=Catellatospora sp. NPDC049111 TaxID=3155271 RepID=UPI0033FCF163
MRRPAAGTGHRRGPRRRPPRLRPQRDAATRLDALDTADLTTDLRAVFAASYGALPPQAAHLFRLLGTAPGPDISLPAAAALAGLATAQARPLLRLLDAAHLVREHQPGRYRMHDLLRLYAAERCRDVDGEPALAAAVQRLLDFCLRTAYTGDRLLDPQRPADPGPQPAPGPAHPLTDAAAALAWFDAEHSCLLAVQRRAEEHGWHLRVWQLAWATSSYHWQRGHLQAGFHTWQAGLAAAERLDDPAALAIAHRLLARSLTPLGRHPDAVTHLEQALALFEQGGAATDQAHTHQTLAWVWGQHGDDRRALAHATRALSLHRELGNTTWEADALNLAGWYSAKLGDHGQARTLSLQALVLYRRHGNRNGEAATLDSLGYVAFLSAAHPTALRHYRQALALFRELGNAAYAADTLAHLGETHEALGEHAAAEDAWRQALDLYRQQQRTREARCVEQQLAALRTPAIR